MRSRDLISAALLLGLTTAIRVLGPVAGLLVAAYSVFTHRVKGLALILAYALIAAVGALAAWPYLWGAPFLRFAEVLTHMARNPAILPVLFQGDLMWSNELPPIYLPALLALTLTLPAILLSLGGMVIALGRIRSAFGESFPLALALLWFAVPFTYVVFLRPPMYDGFRHFLFILPPLFATAGLAVEAILRRLRLGPWRALFLIGVLVPGIVGIARLHPYAYAYFNELAGGPAGAFREYESDYWLMCYKEGIERANRLTDRPRTVFVFAVPEIAEHYAGPLVTIEKFDAGDDQTSPGDWILMTTRNNADLRVHLGDPSLFSIGRLGATYCVMKQVPGEGSAG